MSKLQNKYYRILKKFLDNKNLKMIYLKRLLIYIGLIQKDLSKGN